MPGFLESDLMDIEELAEASSQLFPQNSLFQDQEDFLEKYAIGSRQHNTTQHESDQNAHSFHQTDEFGFMEHMNPQSHAHNTISHQTFQNTANNAEFTHTFQNNNNTFQNNNNTFPNNGFTHPLFSQQQHTDPFSSNVQQSQNNQFEHYPSTILEYIPNDDMEHHHFAFHGGVPQNESSSSKQSSTHSVDNQSYSPYASVHQMPPLLQQQFQAFVHQHFSNYQQSTEHSNYQHSTDYSSMGSPMSQSSADYSMASTESSKPSRKRSSNTYPKSKRRRYNDVEETSHSEQDTSIPISTLSVPFSSNLLFSIDAAKVGPSAKNRKGKNSLFTESDQFFLPMIKKDKNVRFIIDFWKSQTNPEQNPFCYARETRFASVCNGYGLRNFTHEPGVLYVQHFRMSHRSGKQIEWKTVPPKMWKVKEIGSPSLESDTTKTTVSFELNFPNSQRDMGVTTNKNVYKYQSLLSIRKNVEDPRIFLCSVYFIYKIDSNGRKKKVNVSLLSTKLDDTQSNFVHEVFRVDEETPEEINFDALHHIHFSDMTEYGIYTQES